MTKTYHRKIARVRFFYGSKEHPRDRWECAYYLSVYQTPRWFEACNDDSKVVVKAKTMLELSESVRRLKNTWKHESDMIYSFMIELKHAIDDYNDCFPKTDNKKGV
jgi:hypothetical protein